MDYHVLRARIEQERPDIDLNAIDRAYHFAREAHEGQTRYSGEPYIVHPVAAAEILLELNPDLASIQACLMHDVTEDTDRTLLEIEQNFGSEVAELVKGCEKLAVVKISTEEQEHDKWRKMFLAMANDVRIVFIKLSDRLHNMRTLDHVPSHKRARIAKESLEVHAAIASRLGIYQFKSELQDLCFKHLFPEEYQDLLEKLKEHRERSEECMAFAMSQIEQLLVRSGIEIEEVQGRTKHLWSLYEKMKQKDASEIYDIYDLFAVRVILPDHFHEDGDHFEHLYEVLGVIHENFVPIEDRFKDYIARPKANGYRSLHTTVQSMGGDLYAEPTEIQIRTMAMHREAEIGVASHAEYKLGGKLQHSIDAQRHLALYQALEKVQALVDRKPEIDGMVRQWVEKYQKMYPSDRSMVEKMLLDNGIRQKEIDDIRKGRSQEHFSLRPNIERQLGWLRGLADETSLTGEIDLFPNKIFVLTPSRDVIQLSKGSTPVDFAYAIHTEVGHKMVSAKVNGKVVPLEHELHSGDQIDIITRSNAKPSRYWLSLAKTHSARAKIKNWFNKEDREGNLQKGRDLLNKQLQKMGQDILTERLVQLKDYAGKKRTMQEREQLLEAVALGTITAAHVVKQILPREVLNKEDDLSNKFIQEPALQNGDDYTVLELTNKVLITGEDDLPVVLSACCKPRPPHSIVGYVTRGRAIRVHKTNCSELNHLEKERQVQAEWKLA